MDKKYYIDKGFELYAFMIPSDKYTQGIEIGETQNLTSRFYRGYRCISNTTNDRIRQHIKDVDNIWVYVLPLPIVKEKILGYKCETSYVKGLEYNLLKEYKDKKGAVPPLNVFIK